MMAVRYAIHNGNGYNVNELASKFALSTRQFDRKFKIYSGFSPKMYWRLTRLENALKQYGQNKSLTQIAYECGYYDQSHFIHDVKAFTGYHPGFYSQEVLRGLNIEIYKCLVFTILRSIFYQTLFKIKSLWKT